MKKILSLFYFFIFLTIPNLAVSQINHSTEFQKALEQGQIEFFEILENRFKTLPISNNDIQSYDLAIQSKEKGRVEIRYAIEPLADNASAGFPHITFMAKASTIASNDEDSVLAFHGIEDSILKKQYNADWGATVFFQPKQIFSTREHCKMTALFAEGKSMVYIFFLFDDPETNLENYYENVRFAGEAN